METMKAMTKAALENDALVIKKMQLKSILTRDEQKLLTKQNAIKQLDMDRKNKKQKQGEYSCLPLHNLSILCLPPPSTVLRAPGAAPCPITPLPFCCRS
jgi:hypothetical protein